MIASPADSWSVHSLPMKSQDLKELKELQAWFAAQCNGSWEHEYGVKIETLDNPGWSFEAELHGTRLQGRKFDEVNASRSERDWVKCRVESERFEGFGGPLNLEELIEIFLRWASDR